MFPARSLFRATPRAAAAVRPRPYSPFHTSAPFAVKAGDAIPDLDCLVENSPGNKVNLAKELTGRGLIIGVPAAFSPSCSESHIPGYLNSKALKGAGQVFVVSVNDPFVMKAWGSTLDPSGTSGVRFLGDPSAKFTTALDLHFDGAAIFGGDRSKRYALVVEDGKVKEAHVEPDNTGLNVSAADKVLL
ncbi:MAG: TSA family [Lasallia pustulata]|uniref:TSA family n=1 Tax=Lasallia pustulata TaxID=136370 RepID=A0A1W5D1L4_9LECA|nr:MAG: TSA family [Lasallia pustulata]SLM37018.1 tsa family protein [Lasallia pustulata]